MNYYTGIGHRDTPLNVKPFMVKIAKRLSVLNYILRSGGANGADSFFEAGAGKKKEIYLPWRRFNEHPSEYCEIESDTYDIVKNYFNNWGNAKTEFSKLKDTTQKLFIRNYYQLYGYDNTPSDFVIYYADEDESGEPVGGTGFAVYMAKEGNIPTMNIKNPEGIKRVNNLINKLKIDYIYKMIRYYYLFFGDDIIEINEKDYKNIETLADIDITEYYKNIEIRKVLEKYFNKYHPILVKKYERKNIKDL